MTGECHRSSYFAALRAPRIRNVGVALLVLIAQACGGGGSGDSLKIRLATTSLSWNYFPNVQPAAQLVIANATGTYDGTLYVAAVVENDGATNAIDPEILIAINDTQATATVMPADNLAAGTYTGHVVFLACSDLACTHRVGGTPLRVPFTVTVKQPVRANPATVNANVVSGTPVSQGISILPGAGETSFVVAVPAPTATFIQIANQTTGGFTLNLPTLPAGTYTGNIELTGNLGSASTLPVTYTVAPPPGGEHAMSISPLNLTFSAAEGAVAAAQTVNVTQPSWLPGLKAPVINYVLGTPGWLVVTATPAGYSVSANAGALAAGSYIAVLAIEPLPLPANIFSPFQGDSMGVSVALTVGPGLVRPADVSRAVGAEDTVGTLSGNVPITHASGTPVAWNAASNQSWLAVSASGQAGGNLTYTIDPDWLRNIAVNFQEYTATVSLTLPGTPITPTQFFIRVTPQFPVVQGVGPRRIVAGQTTRLVISGRGFAALANPAARLSIPGATITQVQRVNDQKLLVDIQAPAVGSYAVGVGNALGKVMTAESFRVFNITPPGYATVATGSFLRMLLADDEHAAVYGLKINGTLVRYRPGGGGWTADTVPVPNVTNFGLMNDGSLLLTTASPGGGQSNAPTTIQLLNGSTLAVSSQLAVPLGIGTQDWTVPGLPVGLDGKVWMRLGGFCNWRLGYYDPADAAVHNLSISGSLCPYTSGVEFSMARNGERMVLWPHSLLIQNPKPLLYMDSSEQVLRAGNSTQLNSWLNSAHSNNDGTRTLLDNYNVLDELHNRVGNLELPDYGPPIPQAPEAQVAMRISGIISPDGTRAYVMTYRQGDVSQPTQLKPRVYVFNTSVAVGNNPLPLLGYFEVDHYPSCHVAFSGCDSTPLAAIGMDGRTLYFGGSDLLVVAPIPLEQGLTLPSFAGSQKPSVTRTRPWRLKVDTSGQAMR